MSDEINTGNTLPDEEVVDVSGGGTNDWLGKGFNLRVGQIISTKNPNTHQDGNGSLFTKGTCTYSKFRVTEDFYALGFVRASCANCGTFVQIKYSDIVNPNE